MLAARASTTRTVQRITRSFATAIDSASLRVAAVDNKQPTSTVTVLIKAGSRYEPKPGVAHALKNFAFKSTTKRSAIGTTREAELYGGVLSASLTREHLALTAEFLRGDELFFVDVLSSFITSAKFIRHEFEEYVAPLIQGDVASATADPATLALDLAHALAFRTGLGSSLFAPAHSSFDAADIKSFAASTFTKNNIAVLGTGIEQSVLAQLVEKSLASAPATSTAASSPTSTYHGGENRVASHGGLQTVFIGFGAVGEPSAELATLAAHLSPQPSIKWSKGISPITSAIPEGTSVQSLYLPYSDATLVGFLVQGQTAAGVKEAAKAAVEALKSAAATKGVSDEELKKAVAKAKFAAANAFDSREGLVSMLGTKVLAGSDASVATSLAPFDKISASAFSNSASTLLKGKPTYVAVGDVHELPYPDEIGL